MTIRRRFALGICLLLAALGATPVGAADYPAHEVWLGFGGAASFEKNIFNVPDDLESSPELAFSLGYIKNLDERRAFGFHVYGSYETTPSVLVQDPVSGAQELTEFELDTLNIGARYRHTFSRGTWSPYLFVGGSWANGSITSNPTGELTYNGISACAGPGIRVGLGRHFMFVAESFASFGVANWESPPFSNSSGTEFNPSQIGATVSLSRIWGWRP